MTSWPQTSTLTDRLAVDNICAAVHVVCKMKVSLSAMDAVIETERCPGLAAVITQHRMREIQVSASIDGY